MNMSKPAVAETATIRLNLAQWAVVVLPWDPAPRAVRQSQCAKFRSGRCPL